MSILEGYLSLDINKIEPMSQKTKELVLSKRFKDSKGNPTIWKVKAISEDLNERLSKKNIERKLEDGQYVEKFNKSNFQAELIIESVVEPDLKNSRLCEKFGTMDPVEMVKKLLTPGEYLKIIGACMEVNGYIDDGSKISDDELYKASKNSSKAPETQS